MSEVLATYGPLGSLSSGLVSQAEEWANTLAAATQGAGNPTLDSALDGLAGAVAGLTGGLGSASRTAGTGVRAVREHFEVADT
jgi:hypothetical protein